MLNMTRQGDCFTSQGKSRPQVTTHVMLNDTITWNGCFTNFPALFRQGPSKTAYPGNHPTAGHALNEPPLEWGDTTCLPVCVLQTPNEGGLQLREDGLQGDAPLCENDRECGQNGCLDLPREAVAHDADEGAEGQAEKKHVGKNK